MTLVNAKKKALTLEKKSTKSTSAHQKKASHRKKAQKSTMVLLKALTTIPVSSYHKTNYDHGYLINVTHLNYLGPP